MSAAPVISVVMSVYNGADRLSRTMESILTQEGVDFEFIVVNDGSTDASGQILDHYARQDPRVHILHQENQGLTCALINGCAVAQGEYIARQDGGGDVSLPNRLSRQLACISNHPEAVMISCGTRFVGPAGEFLYEKTQAGAELDRNLKQISPNNVKGVSSHPSVMVRRRSYLAVGGYRAAFKVAQDLDLWLRLSEIGECLGLPEVLYQTVVEPGSISHERRDQQRVTAQITVACALARRTGGDETALLESWQESITQDGSLKAPDRLRDAKFYYFLARVLRDKDRARARSYYWRAMRAYVTPRFGG